MFLVKSCHKLTEVTVAESSAWFDPLYSPNCLSKCGHLSREQDTRSE